MEAIFGWLKGGFWPLRMGVWAGKAWDSYRIRGVGAVLRALAGSRKGEGEVRDYRGWEGCGGGFWGVNGYPGLSV